jgi:hypothetical protein
MNLLLHELVPQSFLHICSEDWYWPLSTQLACNAIVYRYRTVSKEKYFTHTHKHTQREENFDVIIIHI